MSTRARPASITEAEFNKVVGGHIKAAREKAGLSPADAAKVLGKSPSTYYRYESGHTGAEPLTLVKLAKLFSCTPGRFLIMPGRHAGAKT